MGEQSHLEKMGRELKCPICLSLLNSAVSLTCNHVFCNSCIMQSMKSDSSCPVCKVPYQRREIRAAPHMDNLVSIYKSMEAASGFNIFVTQTAPTSKLSDEQKQVEVDKSCVKEVSDIVCHNTWENQRKSKRQGSRKNIESNPEMPDSNTVKPSFPTKKRVHVPQYPPSETTPIQTEKIEIGSGKDVRIESKKNSVVLEKTPVLNKRGNVVLSPFFWLRDEEDQEKLSQQIDEDQLLDITPPDVPNFSDIKDSDDESPSKSSPTGGDCGKLNETVDLFDSEMFEWTQRPCSPEIFLTPIEKQVPDTVEFDGIQEKEAEMLSFNPKVNKKSSKEHIKCRSDTEGMGVADDAPPKSPNRKSLSNQVRQSKCKKGRKFREASLKKCGTKNADKYIKVDGGLKMDSGNLVQNGASEHMGSSLNCKQTRKRIKKASFGTSATKSKAEIVPPFSSREKTVNLDDDEMVSELPTLLGKKQIDDQDIKAKTGKVSREMSTKCQADCPLGSKKRKVFSMENNMTEDFHSIKNIMDKGAEVSLLPASAVDDKDVKDKNIKIGKEDESVFIPESNHKKSRKKKKVCFGGISKNVNDHQKDPSNFVVKENQSGGEVEDTLNKRILYSSVTEAKHKMLTEKFQCAFCLSYEETEASGEMIHYDNCRPVTADCIRSNVIHSHRNCTEWAPNVYFENDAASNLQAELARSRRIKCCCCGLKGAALGCYEKSCRRSFHVTCAKLTPQCRWDTDNFVMLCPLHASSKLPNENSGPEEKHRKKCIPKGQTLNNLVMKRDTSKCLSWNSSVTLDKLVICCSALTVEEKEFVSLFEGLSQVTVLKNWDSRVTHVIASTDEKGACKRTLKVLKGILEGKWILNIEWVKACLKAMKPVEEEKYEITVDVHEIRDGPRLGRLRLLNKQPKIFQGFMFYFMGDFVLSYKGYIQDLLVTGGGAILHRKPISRGQEHLLSDSSAPSTFIIYCVELAEKCDPGKKNIILDQRKSDAEALASSTGAIAVSNSWVLNSIAACKLQSFIEQ